MVYTPVPYKTVGELWTASDFNTYYKANFDAGTGLITTKGDLLVATGNRVAARLPIGSNTHTLIADSDEATGVRWDRSGEPVAGVIIIWSGAIVDIPAGWSLCNGGGSTPDLRNRFIVGATSTYAVDATGGATTLDISHSHTMDGVASFAAHTHSLSFGVNTHVHTLGGVGGACNNDSSAESGSYATIATGAHTHTWSGDSETSNAHTHGKTFPAAGAHSHTLATAASSNASMATVPPYYALAFIQKDA